MVLLSLLGSTPQLNVKRCSGNSICTHRFGNPSGTSEYFRILACQQNAQVTQGVLTLQGEVQVVTIELDDDVDVHHLNGFGLHSPSTAVSAVIMAASRGELCTCKIYGCFQK